MPSRIRHVTIDACNPYTLSRFWANVLGFVEDPDNPNSPDDPEALITDPTGQHPGLLFVPVPELKTLKNRVHLDLLPDQARDVTVDTLVADGATLVADHRKPDGAGWAVLADPEGNEFCVERSAAERDQDPPTDSGDRPYPPIHAVDERQLLEGMLDWYRDGVQRKVAGVSPFHARMTPLRSGTTIAGLIKHLALVEDSWFDGRFAGNAEPEPWASAPWDDDEDWEFHSANDEPMEALITLYDEACERSRQAAAGHELDDLAVNATRRDFNLRFAYLHLIEETARHLGHLDALRELADGSIGE
jgi:catechol 2,3-dioxygenase-like lactoylglutathione lyase family enzyme